MKVINPKAVFESHEGKSTTMRLSFESVDSITGNKIVYRLPKIALNSVVIKPSEYEKYYSGFEPVDLKISEQKVEFDLLEDKCEGCYSIQTILKPRELSMEEIEEKLGYPVKIIK